MQSNLYPNNKFKKYVILAKDNLNLKLNILNQKFTLIKAGSYKSLKCFFNYKKSNFGII